MWGLFRCSASPNCRAKHRNVPLGAVQKVLRCSANFGLGPWGGEQARVGPKGRWTDSGSVTQPAATQPTATPPATRKLQSMSMCPWGCHRACFDAPPAQIVGQSISMCHWGRAKGFAMLREFRVGAGDVTTGWQETWLPGGVGTWLPGGGGMCLPGGVGDVSIGRWWDVAAGRLGSVMEGRGGGFASRKGLFGDGFVGCGAEFCK